MNSERNGKSNPNPSPINFAMKLSKQLKLLLQRSDLTVAQLARATGVSPKTIYNWLEEQKPRDISAVKRVADRFGVTLDYICYGIDEQGMRTEFDQYRDEINAGIFEVVLRKVINRK